VKLARWSAAPADSAVVVCGLAGALDCRLRAGTVVVPDVVGLPEGRGLRCDSRLVDAFVGAARSLRLPVEVGPLLTAPVLITGDARREWAERGFLAADMETGLLADQDLNVATVRVILDTPDRSISEEWERPGKAVLQPRLWSELLWLAWAAPLYAVRAARVLNAGLERMAPPCAEDRRGLGL
jgi:nucleoside phosphorylase